MNRTKVLTYLVLMVSVVAGFLGNSPPSSILSATQPTVVHSVQNFRRPRTQMDMTTVSVHAPAETVQIGKRFTVSVGITDLAEPLSAFQFDLTYDPSLISWLSPDSRDSGIAN